jgi:hypothetical protein
MEAGARFWAKATKDQMFKARMARKARIVSSVPGNRYQPLLLILKNSDDDFSEDIDEDEDFTGEDEDDDDDEELSDVLDLENLSDEEDEEMECTGLTTI